MQSDARAGAGAGAGYGPGWAGQGMVLAANGRVHAALALAKKAEAVDPLDVRWLLWRAELLHNLGHLDEGEAVRRRAADLQPNTVDLSGAEALHAVLRGDAAAALAAARRGDVDPVLALQLGPDRAAADAALHEIVASKGESAAYLIAQVHALRGNADETFAWLDRLGAERTLDLQRGLLRDPFLLRFRDDPRLAVFAARLGLPSPAESEALSIDQIRAKAATAGQ